MKRSSQCGVGFGINVHEFWLENSSSHPKFMGLNGGGNGVIKKLKKPITTMGLNNKSLVYKSIHLREAVASSPCR
jgi:hypothetical protein